MGRGGWLALIGAVAIIGALVAGMAVAVARGTFAARAPLSSPTPLAAPTGIYREATVGTPTMLNPLLAQARIDRDLGALLFNGLTRTDAAGNVQPDLAASWKVEQDGQRYTFTLRDGVTWHDGQPFGARDILFTIRTIQDAAFTGDAGLADFWRAVGVETPDERTVVCTLPRPYAPFLAYTDLGILPQHLLAATRPGDLASAPFNLQPVGTGPFAFGALDTTTVEVALKRFDGYYGTKPQLQGVRFRSYADASAAIGALGRGEVDGIGYIPPASLAELGGVAGEVDVYGPSVAGYTALFFNLKGPQFAEREVRRALALAVDRDELVRDGLKGGGTAGAGPILPNSWAYAKQDWPHDPARAAQALDAAGWRVGADGTRAKGGQALAFTLLTDSDPLRTAVATILARQFGAIGVRVTVSAKGADELAGALAARRYDAALSGWEGLAADPDPYSGWHSSQADNGYNFANWANAAADKALEDGRLTTDPAKRRAAYASFQRSFADEVPSLILYYPQYHFAVSKRVSGPNADPLDVPSDRFRTIAGWQIAAR
jgi:peptide/nickel transport system substrate-binding protein